MPKFDDASWHYGGDFPAGLPNEAGATHIGMFVAWCQLSGLAGDLHSTECPEDLTPLRDRQTTPGAWLLNVCDGKFTEEDVNDEGEAFALSYYGDDSGIYDGEESYLTDYEKLFAELDDLYAAPDTWLSFDRLKPVIDRRYGEWKNPKRDGWRSWFR